MKVRFLADADLNRAIVHGLLRREPSIDFLPAHVAGLRALKDPAVLALAGQQNRVLVSHDVATMPVHFRAYQATGHMSSGVFLISQSLDVATAIEQLHLIWAALDPSDWAGQLVWLPL